MSDARERKTAELNGTSCGVVTDRVGTFESAWLASSVLLTVGHGQISARLGGSFAKELDSLISKRPGELRYFIDTAGIASYDILARSAIMRVLLAYRAKFSSIVILAGDLKEAKAAGIIEALGKGAEIVGDAQTFVEILRSQCPAGAQAWRAQTQSVARQLSRHSAVPASRGRTRGRQSKAAS